MQALLTIVVAVVAALAGRWAVTRASAPDATPLEQTGELAALRTELTLVRAANEALAGELTARDEPTGRLLHLTCGGSRDATFETLHRYESADRELEELRLEGPADRGPDLVPARDETWCDEGKVTLQGREILAWNRAVGPHRILDTGEQRLNVHDVSSLTH